MGKHDQTEKKEKKKHPVLRTIIIIIVVALILVIAIGYFKLKKLYNEEMTKANEGQANVIGTEAPDFTLTTTDGEELKLSEILRDKEVVVLNLFASWCGPCEKEFPEFEEVYQENKDKIEIISVSPDPTDSMEDIAKYKAEHNLSFPMSYDREALSFIPYTGYPTTAIIDRNGKVMFCQSGAFPSKTAFENIIRQFMGDDYADLPVYNYQIAPYKDSKCISGVSMKITSDDGTVTEMVTDDDGVAYFTTNEPHTFTVEITDVPEGCKIPSDTLTMGPQSGGVTVNIKE